MPTIWRLDVREDSNDGGVFVATTMPSRWWPERQGSRQRLGHYITAGGMRAHYWSTVDDIASNRQWRAIRIMLTLAAIWLLFWFIPGT